MKIFLRASLALLSLLAFLPAAHAFSYSKITLSGSVFTGAAPDAARVAPADAVAPTKTKLPLTNQRAMLLCGLDPANFSQYQLVIGYDNGGTAGFYVVLKTDGSTVATLLTYTTATTGDGSTGFLAVGKKGIAVFPILSVVGNAHAIGTLSGQATQGTNVLRVVAAVDDNGTPRFALSGLATVHATFVPQQASGQ